MAQKPIYQTVGDLYAGGNRNKNAIGSYVNTGINGYQNTGMGGMSQTAIDAQKRNADLYAAQQASKPPLSFGDNVAMPKVGATPSPTTPPAPLSNVDAAKAVADMTGGQATFGDANLNTNPINQMPTPVQDTGTKDTSAMDAQIKSMSDAIAARYDDMMAQARQVSGMNQSNIRGNIGRVFGANADTSEVAPMTTENAALEANLKSLGIAKNQDMQNLSMTALNNAQNQQNIENQARQAAQQQAFDNLVTQAGLTGQFNGGLTQAAQQNQFLRAIQEAGLTGQYNGNQTLDAQQIAFNKAIQEAGLTGMYNGGLTQGAMQNVADMTGYFNGMPTLKRDQANLTNQQKTLNDYLDYISSTTNNQNTNATKLTNTGLQNTGKIDLANINNAADLEQLLKSLVSKENIASGNNASRETIASQNNAAKVSLLEQRLASGTGSANDGKIYTQIAQIQKQKDAEYNATFKIDPATGKPVQIREFDPSVYDKQIANLIALSEKKN